MVNINAFDIFPEYLAPFFSLDFLVVAPLVLFSILIVYFIGFVVLKYVQYISILNEPYVLLEVKPPSITIQSAFSTKQFFTILHSLDNDPSFTDRLLQNKKRISYEIVSTKKEGIRYLLYVPKDEVSIIRKNLVSYLPGIEIQEISDYIPESLNKDHYSISELKLKNSFVLPLKEQDILNMHDPIAYITGQMTKLENDELIGLQLVTSPVIPAFHSKIVEHVYALQKRIYEGKEIVSTINAGFLGSLLKVLEITVLSIFSLVATLIKDLSKWLVDFMMSSPTRKYEQTAVNLPTKKEEIRDLTTKQKQVQEIVESKINQNMFEVSMRLLIVGGDQSNISLRKKGIIANFSTFSNPGYQKLEVKKPFFSVLFRRLDFIRLKKRLFSFTENLILSVSELSSIYHFPYTITTQTEDIQSIRSIQLPAPITLKNPKNLDIVFAQNIHGESTTPIGLTLDERRRHMYLIGATGMGKTTLLMQMIYQDIQNGKGLAVMDPHGDLATKLLGVIPEHRRKDVIYFNPYDLEMPIGLNVLQMTPGLSDVEKEREKDLIVSSLVSIFFKLYPSATARPRMEHILRNTVLAALSTKNPTLLTAYKLLVDKKYRDKVVAKIDDTMLKEFWEKEFKGFGSFQRAELISPITNKLGRFLTTKTTRNILTQEESKLNFDEIMNYNKILICDLSKGKVGEDISSFLGSLLILKIQLSALNRVHLPQEKRNDFFLYIDEFQNFATITFAQILSEARKYRLDTILAHQTISQIEDQDLLKVILANVGTVISYRTSNPSDEKFILPMFKPQVQEHQIANLPSFHFYIKIIALVPQDVFTGTTHDFTIPHDDKTMQTVINYSRIEYGMDAKLLATPPITDTNKTTTKTTMKRTKSNVRTVEEKSVKRSSI